LRVVMLISKEANQFFHSSAPWELLKSDPLKASKVLNIIVNLIYLLATLLQPYMPAFTEKVTKQLNYLVYPGDLSESNSDSRSFTLVIHPGHVIGSPSPLFRKIEDEEILEYRSRFGGVENKKKGAEFPLHCVLGEISEVADHPSADHLFVLQVNIGEEQPRSIVAGLKSSYSSADLRNRKVVLLLNIKHSNIRGVPSQGLLLTAMKKHPYILTVSAEDEKQAEIGSAIVPEDCLLKPLERIDWKSEAKKQPLETIEGGIVAFGGLICKTQQGIPIIADQQIQGAKIQ